MAADISNVFLNTNDFAETITYTASGEGAASISAVVKYENDEADPGSTAKKAILRVKQSDISEPTYRDSVVIDSKTWVVLNWKSSFGGLEWTIDLQNDERPVI